MWRLVPVIGVLLVVDSSFFIACLTKIYEGGWFPLAVAFGMFVVARAK